MIYASRLAEAKLRGIGWAGFGALVMPVSQARQAYFTCTCSMTLRVAGKYVCYSGFSGIMVTMKSTVNTLPYETENLQKQLLDSRSTIVQ
jgi:hypothetical protein